MRGRHALQLGIIIGYKQIPTSTTVSITEIQYSNSIVQVCILYELKELGKGLLN